MKVTRPFVTTEINNLNNFFLKKSFSCAFPVGVVPVRSVSWCEETTKQMPPLSQDAPAPLIYIYIYINQQLAKEFVT